MAMSEFKRTDIVKGANFYQGVVDGQTIDSGAIHVEEAMAVEKGQCAGTRTVAFPCINGDLAKFLVETVKSWPITAEVTYSLNVTGKSHKLVVQSIRNVGQAQGQPSASVKAA